MDWCVKAVEKLVSENKKLNVVDVGCARSAFINEFLVKYINKRSIKSLGIDPFNHAPQYNPRKHYNFYVQCCVDNIPSGTTQKMDFYVNSIDQASSLLKINTDLFSSKLEEENKFYYPQDIIDRLSKIDKVVKVKVYNLGDLIKKYFKEEIIDFIKIDAEGKDLDICKSLGENLKRVKYIGLECSSHENDDLKIFENGCSKKEAVDFFKDNNFELFSCMDYSKNPENLTQMSDLVFRNLNF
jgi:hypothetical protein